MSGVRTVTDMEFKVGHDNTIDDDLGFHGLIDTEMLDTLDHVEHGVYTLAASEQNRVVAFGDVTTAKIIYVEADGEVQMTLGGTVGVVGVLNGVGGVFPTLFVGGETFTVEIDGTEVAVTFLVGDQTAAEVAARINAAAALAGLATPRATVVAGQLRIEGVDATSAGLVEVTGINARIGFPALTSDAGDNPTAGTSPILIARPADPAGEVIADAKAYFFATVTTGSVTLTNPSDTDAVRVKICIVGDVIE